MDKPLEEHSEEEILDVVERLHLDRVAGDALMFRCAVEFANAHNGDSGRPTGTALPGTERSVRLGGAGTPTVREFAAAAFGARMQMGTWSAKRYLADALDVCHRLPRLWQRVCASEVRVGYARFVAQRTRELSPDAAAFVDARVAEYADGRLPWSRFEVVVEAAVIDADPDAAAALETEEATRTFAKATHSSFHGMRGFYLRAPAAVTARFEATVAFLAEALAELGDTDPVDLRRVKACLLMANPVQAVHLIRTVNVHRARSGDDDAAHAASARSDAADSEEAGAEPRLPIRESDLHPADNDADDPPEDTATDRPDDVGRFLTRFRPGEVTGDVEPFSLRWHDLLPPITLHLHLHRDTLERDEGGVVRWEGLGPITTAYLRDVLGPHHTFKVQPVIDCANAAPVDAYEIPQRHRQAVHLRTPADIFPFSASTSRGQDIDHTEPYETPDQSGAPGQSRLGNYGPMTRYHHRIKTHGAWQVTQPFPGIYVWADPYGHYYLVDHTGTRKITGPRNPQRRRHLRPVSVQTWTGGPRIDYQGHHVA